VCLTVKEKAGDAHDEEIGFPQRPQILAQFEVLWSMLEVGRDSQVSDNKQTENEKGTDPHCPGETDFGKEVDDHEGEDDAA
jgi:hypothetical protein